MHPHNYVDNMKLIPCPAHHLPSGHEEGPINDFSCQIREQTQLFEQLDQYLNPLFQQPEIYNLKENQRLISARNKDSTIQNQTKSMFVFIYIF